MGRRIGPSVYFRKEPKLTPRRISSYPAYLQLNWTWANIAFRTNVLFLNRSSAGNPEMPTSQLMHQLVENEYLEALHRVVSRRWRGLDRFRFVLNASVPDVAAGVNLKTKYPNLKSIFNSLQYLHSFEQSRRQTRYRAFSSGFRRNVSESRAPGVPRNRSDGNFWSIH